MVHPSASDVKGSSVRGATGESPRAKERKVLGSYFHARAPSFQSICRVMKPDPRGRNKTFTIDDPGVAALEVFLVGSYEWLVNVSKGRIRSL